MTRWSTLFALAPLVGAIGCGDIWGFHDLVEVSQDATVPDARATVADGSSEAASDDVADVGTTADDSATDASEDAADDAEDAADVVDASDSEASDYDANDASDAETKDASDGGTIDAGVDAEAGPPACSACAGCCDSHGVCQPGDQTAVCGVSGAACGSCTSHSCLLTFSACCKSTGGCGCSPLLGGSCN